MTTPRYTKLAELAKVAVPVYGREYPPNFYAYYRTEIADYLEASDPNTILELVADLGEARKLTEREAEVDRIMHARVETAEALVKGLQHTLSESNLIQVQEDHEHKLQEMDDLRARAETAEALVKAQRQAMTDHLHATAKVVMGEATELEVLRAKVESLQAERDMILAGSKQLMNALRDTTVV